MLHLVFSTEKTSLLFVFSAFGISRNKLLDGNQREKAEREKEKEENRDTDKQMEIETELEGVKMKAGGNGVANRLLHTLLHIH